MAARHDLEADLRQLALRSNSNNRQLPHVVTLAVTFLEFYDPSSNQTTAIAISWAPATY